jgi:hypothetical protein
MVEVVIRAGFKNDGAFGHKISSENERLFHAKAQRRKVKKQGLGGLSAFA